MNIEPTGHFVTLQCMGHFMGKIYVLHIHSALKFIQVSKYILFEYDDTSKAYPIFQIFY